MSSTSSLREYHQKLHEQNLKNLQKTFEMAVSAIKNKDIKNLQRTIKGFPQYYTQVNDKGCNLLHLSFIYDRLGIFNYLLSCNSFDLEATNGDHNTILRMVLLLHDKPDNCNYYAGRLIKAGANIHRVDPKGNTYLHLTIDNRLFETAELLIQKGAKINERNYDGHTALHRMIDRNGDSKMSEGVCLLLYYNADPTIGDSYGHIPFDYAVMHNLDPTILEHLFNYTVDSHSKYEISAEILSILIKRKSSLLDNVMQIASQVIIYDNDTQPIHFSNMTPDLMTMMINKFRSFLRTTLFTKDPSTIHADIDTFEILLNSELRSETIEFIGRLTLRWIVCRAGSKKDLQEVTRTIFYLLSYGLNLGALDYDYVYQNQGYSDLFKTMLHMDCMDGWGFLNVPILRIICDINCEFGSLLPNLTSFSFFELEQLLDQFAHPELRHFCLKEGEGDLLSKAKQMPRIPRLLELARNAARRYLVQRGNLKKTSQYYTLIRRLNLGPTYEKILTFETKLYECRERKIS